jgi:hypothetical protein
MTCSWDQLMFLFSWIPALNFSIYILHIQISLYISITFCRILVFWLFCQFLQYLRQVNLVIFCRHAKPFLWAKLFFPLAIQGSHAWGYDKCRATDKERRRGTISYICPKIWFLFLNWSGISIMEMHTQHLLLEIEKLC